MEDEFDIVYRQLFRKYYANLLFYATRMVGEEDAEDVVQEVFVELWHRKDSVTVGEQIQAFLYRAVYTRALNVLKHRDIKNSYEAVMQEVYNKRALFYQPDDNDVLKRIESEPRTFRLALAARTPSAAVWLEPKIAMQFS